MNTISKLTLVGFLAIFGAVNAFAVLPVQAQEVPAPGETIVDPAVGNSLGRPSARPIDLNAIKNVRNGLRPFLTPGEKIDVNKVPEGKKKVNDILNVLKARNAAYKNTVSDSSKINELDNTIKSVENEIGNVDTPAKLRSVVNRVRSQLLRENALRGEVLNSFVRHFENRIDFAENRASNIAERLNAIESNGTDVNALRAKLNSANAAISAARDIVNQVKNKISAGNFDLNEIRNLLKDGIAKLNSAYTEFRAIALAAKEL